MTVQQALGRKDGALVYNSRGANLGRGRSDTDNPLQDPLGLVYVAVPKGGTHTPRDTVEPLVLRANAGDWIHVTLVNTFRGDEPVFSAYEAASRFGLTYASPYNFVQIAPSPNVGLHAQLLSYDMRTGDGASVGANAVQTAPPGGRVDYWWYAGSIDGATQTPVEFGPVNLLPSDPLMQVYHGLFGALVVEPAGSRWQADPTEDRNGTYIFLRDTESGAWWSATSEPRKAPEEKAYALFSDEKATFVKTVGTQTSSSMAKPINQRNSRLYCTCSISWRSERML